MDIPEEIFIPKFWDTSLMEEVESFIWKNEASRI